MRTWPPLFQVISDLPLVSQGLAVQKEANRGALARPKPRFGVLPGRVERDRTKYTGKTKHQQREE